MTVKLEIIDITCTSFKIQSVNQTESRLVTESFYKICDSLILFQKNTHRSIF